MDVSRREIVAHATLVFYEVAAVPFSILATFFVLFFVGGLLWVTQFVGELIGIGASVIGVITGLLVALMFLAMAATGGFVVRRYQRTFEKSFGALGPLAVLAVPLLGVVGSTVYAVFHLGTFSPPEWLNLILVLSVYALTFRAIAVYSMLDGARRTGARIGTVAGIPVAISLVTLVSGLYLDAGMNEAGQLVLTTVTDAGIPLDPMLLVGLPALIALAYGIYCTVDDGIPLYVPNPSLPSVPGLGLLGRLRFPLYVPNPSLPSVPGLGLLGRLRSTDRSSRSGSGRSARAPPPSSPSSVRSRNRQSSGSASRGDGGSASNQSGGSSSSATGSRGTGGSSGSGSGASSSANAGGAASEGSSGSASDTRIFSDDFGQYSNGGSPVETCPDCGDDIPSDGVYQFCPHCGSEL